MDKQLKGRMLCAIFLLCLIPALFIGCAAGFTHQVTEEQDDSQIQVKLGDKLQVALKGNPTTGYAWEIAVNNPNMLAPQGEVEYQQEKTNLVGSGGTFLFTFKAIAKGNTSLKLIYRRPFEKDVPPIRDYQLNVQVE